MYKVGLDIDDVLYHMSAMINERGIKYFQSKHIPYQFDCNAYYVHERFKISDVIAQYKT